MIILFQVLLIYLVLLTTSFAVPNLQPLLYTVMFLLLLFILFKVVLLPFTTTFLTVFEAFPNPFMTLLVGSVLLFYMSSIITDHIAESGYASLAKIGHFAVKVSILLVWLHEIGEMMTFLSTFIKK